MENIKNKNSLTFYELQWDSNYFGISCAKAVLYEALTLNEWDNLKKAFNEYKFVSIENQNSQPINSQLIGKETTAFLADVNIQFSKRLNEEYQMPKGIEINNMLERNEQIIEVGEFKFSKFTEDPELSKRGGNEVYHQWLINSFDKDDKYYAISRDENGNINGFLLHSYSDNVCIVELISVAKKATKSGIGTKLFRAVECSAYEKSCNEIRVGTQVRNIRAINFYNKVGCKQVGCHQVYHLWGSQE